MNKGILIVLKIVLNICYSISILSDKSLMDTHTSAAAVLGESIYMPCALDNFVAS